MLRTNKMPHYTLEGRLSFGEVWTTRWQRDRDRRHQVSELRPSRAYPRGHK